MKFIPILLASILIPFVKASSGQARNASKLKKSISSSHHSPTARKTQSHTLNDSSGVCLRFRQYSYYLTPDSRASLRKMCASINCDTSYKIVIMSGGGSSTGMLQLSWLQANVTREFLLNHSCLKSEGIIFRYDGDARVVFGTVVLRYAKPGETGASIEAPPYPGHTMYFRSTW